MRNWDESDSAGRAGQEILTAAQSEIEAPAYAAQPRADDLRLFGRFLRDYRPRKTPTVAVPGLSPDGQLRAFDFQVVRGEQLVAGTSSAAAAAD